MSSARVTPIRLLLVDDHEVVRVGLRTLLHNNQGITIVGEAGSKAAAVRAVTQLNPDIVLMDARLPDGSGIEAAREIHASHPTTRIIFLTSYADDDAASAAVLAGAQGYVLKNIDSVLLIRSIRDVVKGHSLFNSAPAPRAPDRPSARPVQADQARTQSLAPQEERVLALVAGGLTNKEIAARLQLSNKTVKHYLTNMFQKLGISRRAQAATLFTKHRIRRRICGG